MASLSDDIFKLTGLTFLAEEYFSKVHVTLVPEKTKLLFFFVDNQAPSVLKLLIRFQFWESQSSSQNQLSTLVFCKQPLVAICHMSSAVSRLTDKLCTEPFLYMYCIHAPQTQNCLHCTVSITHNCLEIKILLKDTTLEWEPTCLICLRLSSRHCKLLLTHHQPSQHLSIGRCLIYCICIDGCPDVISWKKLRAILIV